MEARSGATIRFNSLLTDMATSCHINSDRAGADESAAMKGSYDLFTIQILTRSMVEIVKWIVTVLGSQQRDEPL